MSDNTSSKKSLPIYGAIDQPLKEKIERNGIKLSCSEGCDACCYQLVMLDTVEAIVIAKTLRAQKRFTKSMLAQLRYQATAFSVMYGRNRMTYFKAKVPCVLLDTKTHMCTAYDQRPVGCRTYFVASPKELCATTEVNRVLDTEDFGLAAYNMNRDMAEEISLPYCVGTLAEMLLAMYELLERKNSKPLFDLYSRFVSGDRGVSDAGEYKAERILVETESQ